MCIFKLRADKCHDYAHSRMERGNGTIRIGDNVLLTPGLQIVSAGSVEIGDNVMVASRVIQIRTGTKYMTDSTPGPIAAIRLEDNVWLGEGCKYAKALPLDATAL